MTAGIPVVPSFSDLSPPWGPGDRERGWWGVSPSRDSRDTTAGDPLGWLYCVASLSCGPLAPGVRVRAGETKLEMEPGAHFWQICSIIVRVAS